jgi:hemolysin activation/secretion protein
MTGAACVHANESTQDLPDPEQNKFNIWEYRIEGNTLLNNQEIERAVYGYLGPDKTITDVEEARTSLEATYRQRGYGTVLVDIPEQNVDSGIVRLNVTEAVVSRVKVTGSRYFSNRWIKKQVPSLQEGEVPDVKEVQKDLAMLNTRSNDRSITPILRPGKGPGEVEMELKVKDKLPIGYSFELNDRNTADTTDLRFNASVSFDNLWQREHGLTLNYQTSPKDTDEVEVWVANYLYKPSRSSDLILLYAVDSDSDVATVGGVGVLGNGRIYGTRYIHPMSPSGDIYHSLIAGFDYKDFEDNVLLSGVETDEIATAIDYGLFSINYTGSYLGTSSPTEFNFGLNFGLRGFFNNEKEFEQKRTGADPNFWKLTGQLDRRFDLLESEYGLRTRLGGQFAGEPLISNEQFAMGGADTVRGYFEADVLVDQGIIGSVELESPLLFQEYLEIVNYLQWFTFIDYSTGRIREALPDQDDTFDLMGIGAGLRFTLWHQLDASFAWARPLKSTNSTEEDDDRMVFSVKYQQ